MPLKIKNYRFESYEFLADALKKSESLTGWNDNLYLESHRQKKKDFLISLLEAKIWVHAKNEPSPRSIKNCSSILSKQIGDFQKRVSNYLAKYEEDYKMDLANGEKRTTGEQLNFDFQREIRQEGEESWAMKMTPYGRRSDVVKDILRGIE